MKISKKDAFIIILSTSLIITSSTLILFTTTPKKNNNSETNDCIKAGCSGQLCVDKNTESGISTCEWKEIYKCYRLAICEKQNTGQCGFTQNPEFQKCLTENSKPLNKLIN